MENPDDCDDTDERFNPALGCPGEGDGTYTGTFWADANILGSVESCSDAATLTIDAGADSVAEGAMGCTFSTLFGDFPVTLELFGDWSSATQLDGTLVISGSPEGTWEATWDGDSISGEFSGELDVGSAVPFEGTFSLSR